jgi:hypothetical protein
MDTDKSSDDTDSLDTPEDLHFYQNNINEIDQSISGMNTEEINKIINEIKDRWKRITCNACEYCMHEAVRTR